MRVCQFLPVMVMLGVLLSPASAQQTGYRTIHQFDNNPGGLVPNGLISANGALYGTTQFGGTDNGNHPYGTIFKLQAPASPGGTWTETALYTFYGLNGDGAEPLAPPVAGPDGVLYGTTRYGGMNAQNDPLTGEGVVYELQPPSSPGGAWIESVLHMFTAGFGGSTDGDGPFATPVLCTNPAFCTEGALYGTTVGGGTAGLGTVFELQPPSSPGGTWTETVLYNFGRRPDGGWPWGLVMSDTGVLYGVTEIGGSKNAGTVFELAPPATPGGAWTERVLYFFKGGSDGSIPFEPPLIGPEGTLYGTTGGCSGLCTVAPGHGIVFTLSPPASAAGQWRKETLHTFPWGDSPDSPLVFREGAFYGTTGTVYQNRRGQVYRLQRQKDGSWDISILHTFEKWLLNPAGNFVMDKRGTIFGTTMESGATTITSTAYRIRP
jgi:uncharacterized repeat protein (TIGR03803 family)